MGAKVRAVASPEGAALEARAGQPLERYSSGSELWRAEQRFVVIMRGRFVANELADAIERIYALADPPDEVIFVEGHDLSAYDRSVLTFYERDVKRTMPRRVSVVIRQPMWRMVVRATALGFRVVTGRNLDVFETLDEALATKLEIF
jgi:hypothetical protein